MILFRFLPAVCPLAVDPAVSDDWPSQRRPPQRDRLPPTQNCLPLSVGTSRVCARIHAIFLGRVGALVHGRKGKGRHVRGGHHHPTPSLWRVAAVTCPVRKLPQQLGQLRLFPRPQSRNKGQILLPWVSVTLFVILCHILTFSVIFCHFSHILIFVVILCHLMSFFVILCHILTLLSFYVYLRHYLSFCVIFRSFCHVPLILDFYFKFSSFFDVFVTIVSFRHF